MSTYQAASGAGAAGHAASLRTRSIDYAAGKQITRQGLPAPDRRCNLFSHDTNVAENGYNEEENKLIAEMRKRCSTCHASRRRADLHPRARRCAPIPRQSRSTSTGRCRPQEARRHPGADAPGVKLVDDPASQPLPDAARAAAISTSTSAASAAISPAPTGCVAVRRRRPTPEGGGVERGADRRGTRQAESDGGGITPAPGQSVCSELPQLALALYQSRGLPPGPQFPHLPLPVSIVGARLPIRLAVRGRRHDAPAIRQERDLLGFEGSKGLTWR